VLRIAVSSCERSYYTQGRAPWPSAESNIQRVSSSALVSTGSPQWEGAVQRRTSQLCERRCVLALRFSWPSADALEFLLTSTVYDNDTMIGLERWLYCWSAIIRVLFPFCVTRQSPDAPDYILDRDHLALCPLVFSL